MKTTNFRNLIKYSPDKMQKSSLASTKKLLTELYCFEPGQAQRSTRHSDSEKLFLILEGIGRFSVGHTTRELTTGTSVFIPAGEEHGVVNMSDQRLVLLAITTPPPSGK